MDKPAQDNLLPFQQSGSGDQRRSSLLSMCATGRVFRGRYRILNAIGKGGFGITFLARDVQLPSRPLCVIKQLCPKLRDTEALLRAQKRFEREARILGELGGHPQIPMLLNYFEQDGEFFLVQEYIRGSTLSRLVKQQGTCSEQEVRAFLAEILPLLTYVHENKVIHRDIKPPNLMRCRTTGRLVLLDFGAVKECVSFDQDDTYRAATTHFVGTMGFAPPEQLALRATYATDIYAVGVTCLFLLTGKSPAKLGSDPATGELNWQGQVQISASLSRILTQMVSVSLRDRYSSAEQVLKMLSVEEVRDELEQCMHRQGLPPEALPDNQVYVSPSARMAASIRDWRDRRQSISWNDNWNLGRARNSPELMYSR
ncbi:MAG: serine/threonine protein kinase [Synechococcales cyanobacterium RU_4_20]|nr:serine/threonine protein kinase [Synechococcales cyanobacterium RU_4_20]NJR68767.1 serine/threonine protein kinase [Synechococcales cyanobacterium CRU_2_2]